jgi:ribonuclease P protein component
MAKRFGFGKKEKLKSRKSIDTLFQQGKSFAVFPIRVTYSFLPAGSEPPLAQVGVTASKRYFKKAVDRNRLKRLMREAYRLQKEALLHALVESGQSCQVFFMFTDKTIAPFEVIYTAMSHCLKRLTQKIPVKHEDPT